MKLALANCRRVTRNADQPRKRPVMIAMITKATRKRLPIARKGGIVSVAKRMPMYVDPHTIQTMMRLTHRSGPAVTRGEVIVDMARRTLQVRT